MSTDDQNRPTWRQIQKSIAKSPDREYWNRWRAIIKPLIDRAIDSQFDVLFRAGMSMSHVIFSTLDHHGLRNEPRVAVEVTADWKLRIIFSTTNYHSNFPEQFEIVEPHLAFPVFTRYLQHLWEETLPEPIPEILRNRLNYEPDPMPTDLSAL